jgi:hypothetical protein
VHFHSFSDSAPRDKPGLDAGAEGHTEETPVALTYAILDPATASQPQKLQ